MKNSHQLIQSSTDFVSTLRRHYQTRLMLLCFLVGITAGLGALLFTTVLNQAGNLFMGHLIGYWPPMPGAEGPTKIPDAVTHRWLWFIVPALGGLLSGLTVYFFAPEAAGHGTDSVISSFHHGGGAMRKRIPFVKTIATAFTLGTGGSAGREGPITHVGSGLGSLIGTLFKSSDSERRLLLLAGAGAGLGAIFRSPLGGALFVTEVVYRDVDFEAPALVPSFIASITAYSIYCSITGTWGAVFTVPTLTFNHVVELPVYILLGLLCAGLGVVYLKTMHWFEHDVFDKLRVPIYIKPAIGGVLAGCVGFFLPQAMGQGYGWVQLAMDGQLALGIIVAVTFVKIISTSFTLGSGGIGGTFAPSVVIGGMLGASLGTLMHQWLPNISPNATAYALVGMAGFLAGVAKTPLSALIMVSEMTMGYGLLVPLMLATAAAYILTPRKLSLFKSQVNSRVDSPAHDGEFVSTALEHIFVRSALPSSTSLITFRRDQPLADILPALAGSKQQIFPVLNDDNTLLGVIDFQDVRIFFTEHDLPAPAVIAHDLLAPAFVAVTLDEDLASVLRKFKTTGLEELPVVEKEGEQHVVAVISRRDINAAYYDRIL